MTTEPQCSGSPNAAQDVAHLGFVRPPILYLTSIVTGALIQLAKPFPFLPRALAVPLGFCCRGRHRAVLLRGWEIPAAGTPVPARKPTTVIVSTGPYRFTRNPIYLAFSLLQLGIAIWVNSLWLLATLVGAVAVIHYVVIPKEEEYLERRFGAQYLDYKRSVRRWL